MLTEYRLAGQTEITTISGQLDYLGQPVEELHSLLDKLEPGKVRVVDV